MALEGKEHIDTIEFKKHTTQLHTIVGVMDDLQKVNESARKLRYADVDVESEKEASRMAPDELYIPQHLIDSNIRKEQSSYIQYIVQSNRAVVMVDVDEPARDVQVIEKDITDKIRFDGWQLPMFANVDGMQQNGYGIMEVVQDLDKSGDIAYEFVAYGDIGFPADTKDLQEAEMIVRHYYFSKTRLLAMCDEDKYQFDRAQVNKVVDAEPNSDSTSTQSMKERSLYRIQKVMFRVKGQVYVAWTCDNKCDDWIRQPQPLFVGRRKAVMDPLSQQPVMDPLSGLPQSEEAFETTYPYFLFPYLISENDTIGELRGRAFLDQDSQEAVSSLMSSFCTAHRRAAGLYFSRDVSDPNDDILTQKNIFFKSGALINGKVQQFQLTAPGADLVSAIQAIVSANQAETSQVNWAASNRKDSRKTATEISASMQTQQSLSTVQVVLFSNSLRTMYSYMFGIIQSRVNSGVLKVPQTVLPMYSRRYLIKPSGDTDVIERQQQMQAMMQAWPVMSQTAAAPIFLSDMLIKAFPDAAPKYIQAMQMAAQQQQMQQQQTAGAIANGLMQLANSPDMFSDQGKVVALPKVQAAAQAAQQMMGGQPQ